MLILVSGAALGAIMVFFIADPSNPPSLPRAQSAAKAPVVDEPYTDEEAVDLIFRRSPESTITAPVGGVVTASKCKIGADLISGLSGFSIDGKPLINLHTAMPMFRELKLGDRGADVAALTAELRRLGTQASAGDTFTQRDLRAVRSLIIKSGGSPSAGHVSPTNITWIPAGTVTVFSCHAGLAQHVAAGATLATVGQAPEVTIGNVPADRLPGKRKLRLDDVSFTLPQTVRVTSTPNVAALANTPSYLKAAAGTPSGATVTVAASLVLAHPVSVVPLPPSAVAAASGTVGCVASGNRTYPVRIVGSTAGSTLVLFTGNQPRPATVSLTKPTRCT